MTGYHRVLRTLRKLPYDHQSSNNLMTNFLFHNYNCHNDHTYDPFLLRKTPQYTPWTSPTITKPTQLTIIMPANAYLSSLSKKPQHHHLCNDLFLTRILPTAFYEDERAQAAIETKQGDFGWVKSKKNRWDRRKQSCEYRSMSISK